MKKRLSLVAVLGVMVLILAAVLAPGPAVAAGQAYHYSFAGKGADASWSTCPFEPVPNMVCTDTYISVAEQVYKEDGTKFPSTTLSLYQYSYKFDRRGNYIFVSESYGFGDATLSVGRQLKTASASATVPITTCTADRRGNWTCRDNGTVTVSASWTGWGDLVKSNSNYHTVSKGYTYNSHFRGMYRDATATGQVNGSDLGTLWWASIYDSKWTDVSICHGTC